MNLPRGQEISSQQEKDNAMHTDNFLEPHMPSEKYLWDAWFGCLHWCLGEPGMVQAFRDETGNNWYPGTAPLDRMIDKATGADREFLLQFAAWVNERVWGGIGSDD